MSEIDRNGDFTGDEVCYEHPGAASAVNRVRCEDSSLSQGRYVFVFLTTGAPVVICEVEVFSNGVEVDVPPSMSKLMTKIVF